MNIILSLPNGKNGPQEVFRVWFRVFWGSMMCINPWEILIIKHIVTCFKLLDWSSYVYSFSPGLPLGINNISRWFKCGPLDTTMVSMTWVTVHCSLLRITVVSHVIQDPQIMDDSTVLFPISAMAFIHDDTKIATFMWESLSYSYYVSLSCLSIWNINCSHRCWCYYIPIPTYGMLILVTGLVNCIDMNNHLPIMVVEDLTPDIGDCHITVLANNARLKDTMKFIESIWIDSLKCSTYFCLPFIFINANFGSRWCIIYRPRTSKFTRR